MIRNNLRSERRSERRSKIRCEIRIKKNMSLIGMKGRTAVSVLRLSELLHYSECVFN